jgi:hypothetical protein
MKSGGRTFLWHGSNKPIPELGSDEGPDKLHLGTLSQAAMRSASKYLHLVEVSEVKMRRTKDKGSDSPRVIARARRDGMGALVYLNRYEGIKTASLEHALEIHQGKDLDDLTDARFKTIFPEARSSMLVLDLTAVKMIGCFKGEASARRGIKEMVLLGGRDAHRKAPAAEMGFNEWIGKRAPKVVDPKDFGPDEQRWIDECQERLWIAAKRLDYDAPDIPGLSARDVHAENGMIFTRTETELLVRDQGTGELMGGIYGGMVFVEEAHRGKGVAVALHVCAEETRCIGLKPSHFSKGGFASRKSAHRTLCERALAKNETVCQENIEDYGLTLATENPELSI